MSSNDQDYKSGMRGPNYDWQTEAKHYEDKYYDLQSLLSKVERSGEIAALELDIALDALTMTQEEWLLRTKYLETENYRLRDALHQIVVESALHDSDYHGQIVTSIGAIALQALNHHLEKK